jgi:MFS family permease
LPYARARGHGHDASGRHRLSVLRLGLPQFDESFWRYVASFSLFSVGLAVIDQLYPLYLHDRGEGIVMIGNASLALYIGCVAGTVPTVLMLRYGGLRRATMVAFAGYAACSAVRILEDHPFAAYGGAFGAGFFLAVLTVGIAITVARLTKPANRVEGFSWFFVATIAASFIGNLLAGEIPAWLGHLPGEDDPGDQKAAAILAACLVSAIAAIPAGRLRFPTDRRKHERMYLPRSPVTLKLLAAVSLWSFAVGLFAPFFASYFSSHLEQPLHTVGVNFALGQVTGAVFTLFAPSFVDAWGMKRSVRFMMFGAGVCAFFLSLVDTVLPNLIGYSIYMGFVTMAKAPLDTLLMNQARTEEQAGMSVIFTLCAFAAVAVGSYVGGRLIALLGYDEMLAIAGACCMLAAVGFIGLMRGISFLSLAPEAVQDAVHSARTLSKARTR